MASARTSVSGCARRVRRTRTRSRGVQQGMRLALRPGRVSMRGFVFMLLLLGALVGGCRQSQEMPPFPGNDASPADGPGSGTDAGVGTDAAPMVPDAPSAA